MPIGFDILRMQSESRKTEIRMRMANIKYRFNGRHIDARHDHRFHPTRFLACNHFFAVGIKRFFINMAMRIDHLLFKILESP